MSTVGAQIMRRFVMRPMDVGAVREGILRLFPLIICSLILVGCENESDGVDPVLDNSLLNGPWILMPDSNISDTMANFIVFDGAGNVSDFGVFNPSTPPGDYTMYDDSTGTLRLYFEHDPDITCEVRLISELQGRLQFMKDGQMMQADLVKVVDPGQMAGLWIGQLHALGRDVSCSIHINESGQVTNASGLAGVVSGRAYAITGNIALAFLRTGELDGFSQINLYNGQLSGNEWSGVLAVDQSNGEGTFNLTR